VDDREEMARRFYRLKSFDAIEETYQKKVRELEETHQSDTTALATLQKERDQAKAGAEKLAEEMAKNQPGQSSELYKKPNGYFWMERSRRQLRYWITTSCANPQSRRKRPLLTPSKVGG